IFISDSFKNSIESSLLIPIITSKELRKNRFKESNKCIINPFDKNGQLIDLAKYPKAKSYFLNNREELERRHVAKRNPAHWYKTIDKIKPEITHLPKILLPDISGNTLLFIDKGKYYPHHNLYFILGMELPSLKLLASILMSRFVLEQLYEIGNKMNGGYPRWQSQNLRKLRIPILQNLSTAYTDKIIKAYDNNDLGFLNEYITIENIIDNSKEKGQMQIFEPSTEY
ncbi:MAG: hypothetical protein AAFW73_05090, partial [Bacteroidota bacterium]